MVGRNAKVITGDVGEDVHIILDRTTGKTMDLYIEFFSHADVVAIFNKLNRQKDYEGKPVKLGDRHVDLVLSNQAELMADLFPRAKNIRWEGQVPKVVDDGEPYNTGFRAFITTEELMTLLRFAQYPNRVSPIAHFFFFFFFFFLVYFL
jgi:hypothetical protein